MEVRDLWAVAMRRRWVVLLVFLLTTALGAAFAFSQPKPNESAATIAFTPDLARDAGFVPPTGTLDGLVSTYAQTAKSRSIRIRAEQELGRPLPGTVDTETQQGAGILRIVGKVPPYAIEAQKDIHSLKELKGKTIAIGGRTDITRLYYDRMLEPNGVHWGDYDAIVIGSTTGRLAALKSGAVAATMLLPPFSFRAEAEGT